MNADTISMIAGGALSLIFSYVPGIATWYNKLEADYKRLVMGVVLGMVTLGLVLINCVDKLGYWTCTQATVVEWLKLFLAALMANQGIDRISPKVGEKRGEAAELAQG